MKIYKFAVTATVKKIIEIRLDPFLYPNVDEAQNEAMNLAHGQFNVLCDGSEEDYDETTELIHIFDVI